MKSTPGNAAEFALLLKHWNAQGEEVVHVKVPNDKQRKRFRALRKSYPLEEIFAAVEKIKLNSFHIETCRAQLHWFLLPEKFEAVSAYTTRGHPAAAKAPSWARGQFDKSKYEKPYQPPDPSIFE